MLISLRQKYRNEFNTNLALTEIYKYAKRYRNQVRDIHSAFSVFVISYLD